MTLPPIAALLADPPWNHLTWSAKGQGRSAAAHYDVMALAELKAFPLPPIAGDAVLFLWTTDAMLAAGYGHELIRAWGFAPKTVAFYWVKTTKDGTGFPIGTGHWTRANPEQCLLATRGRPKRLSASVPRLIIAPRRFHSQKPDEIYPRIEALVAGPYCELFARQSRPGWYCLGQEVTTGIGARRWHADARELRDAQGGVTPRVAREQDASPDLEPSDATKEDRMNHIDDLDAELHDIDARIDAWLETCDDERSVPPDEIAWEFLNLGRKHIHVDIARLKRRCEAEDWPAELRACLAETEERI